MYKTFTITITMPMSWYSKNADQIIRWTNGLKDNVRRTAKQNDAISIDIQETPDPTELETPSNITDLLPYIDDTYNDEVDDDTNEPL